MKILNKGKTFNYIFLTITSTLVILSLLAFISIHWKLLLSDNYSFSFAPKGIDTYIKCYSSYNSLFSITIATVAAYYGILRLKIATDTYKSKLKQDRFEEFKFILESRLSQIEDSNSIMKQKFEIIRQKLFNFLYQVNFKISNKQELTLLYKTFFNGDIVVFENGNKTFKNIGIYKSTEDAYAFSNFSSVLLNCLEKTYSNAENDLKALYLGDMDKKRIIDYQAYILIAGNYGKNL